VFAAVHESAIVMGFGRRPHCGRGGRHRGRRPKAAKEGTRGRLGTISGAALWGFGCSGLSVCNRCGGGAVMLTICDLQQSNRRVRLI
jgi:hypothetical protein